MAFVAWQTWTTGQTVTAADLNQDIKDNLNALFPDEEAVNTWSPTLEATTTDPGTSSVDGAEYTMGAIQFFWARWVLSSGGSGTYFVTLPSTATQLTASSTTGKGQIIGGFHIVDDSPPHMLGGNVTLATTTTARFSSDSVAHGTSSGQITDSTPRTWASGDVLHIFGQYPIA